MRAGTARRPAVVSLGAPVAGPDLPAPARALLDTPPPPVDAGAAEAALRDHYDLDGRARPLAAERDRNFMVSLPDGTRRVFKVYHGADDAPTRAFQQGALLHMERVDVGAPVPRLVRTRHGGEECEVLAGLCGVGADIVKVRPPLTCGPAEAELFLKRFDGVLRHLAA